jgi:hypothetical protein
MEPKPLFGQNKGITFIGKKLPIRPKLGLFLKFLEKPAQSEQSLDVRKFAQFGHPACRYVGTYVPSCDAKVEMKAFQSLVAMALATPTTKPGLPDYSWYNIPKREKYTKMAIKYTKWP